MKTQSLLIDRLRVVRNLTVSSYGALLKTGTLRSDLPEEVVGPLNNLVYKTKARFDSLKVLVQTVPTGANNDGAIALAESVLSHLSMIEHLLSEAGLPERAAPFSSVYEPLLLKFSRSENASTGGLDLNKESIRLPSLFKGQAPDDVIYWFCVLAAKLHSSDLKLSHADGLARIIREITFPPEYQQAGLSILNYFGAVLQDKYPDIPVAITIKQQRDSVTLVITLPDGSKDTVTKALNDYGLVVTGKMSARELVSDDIKALALEQKLQLAQMEVRQTRDLLRIQEQYASKRVESLEAEVKNLYSLLGREFTARERLQDALLSLTDQLAAGHVSDQASRLLATLAEAIAERNSERTKVILEDIQSSEPGLFNRLNDFFLSAATSGVIGNYVYDWIKVLWPVLPK